ncbi:HAD family hydrolase [Ruegeria faecimaris]|uniref:HAD family hydrolase n=1 Tax=Ruegeria faecimaris TaxID=686389 RepID=UPI00248FADBA|nr:HAD family hydrolase [Ruegeria faecimaris]
MRTLLISIPLTILFASAPLADPLPSWTDTATKDRIIAFVEGITDPDSPDYVTPAARIATFDNDGTLWAEQPVYFQLLFAIDRLKEMAAADPGVLTSDVLRAAVEGDMETVAASGTEGLLEIVSTTHSGLTVDEFQAAVRSWLDTARHSGTGLAYDQMVYQPMLELLTYLRDEGFRTYIASGGGLHFIRVFSESAYNIPPEQVIGSIGNGSYSAGDGPPRVMKDPGLFFIDDKAGKPIAIEARIGRRPVIAVGNSDGDFQMLEWTTAGEGARLGILLHHTDSEREYAYGRESHIGQLARGLDEAASRGWLVIDMARDWERIWPSRE